MAEKDGRKSWVMVNRAPVLTLWAAVMAEVLGFDHDEALTLGRGVAGLNAYSKGVSLGLFQPIPKEVQEQRRKMRKEETVTVDLLHRAVPAKHTEPPGPISSNGLGTMRRLLSGRLRFNVWGGSSLTRSMPCKRQVLTMRQIDSAALQKS